MVPGDHYFPPFVGGFDLRLKERDRDRDTDAERETETGITDRGRKSVHNPVIMHRSAIRRGNNRTRLVYNVVDASNWSTFVRASSKETQPSIDHECLRYRRFSLARLPRRSGRWLSIFHNEENSRLIARTFFSKFHP